VNNRAGASQLPPRDVDLEIGKTEVQGLLVAGVILNSPPNDELSNSQWLLEWQVYARCIYMEHAGRFKSGQCPAPSPSSRAAKNARRAIEF
jgi:hypothetical protein